MRLTKRAVRAVLAHQVGTWLHGTCAQSSLPKYTQGIPTMLAMVTEARDTWGYRALWENE